MLHLLSEAGRSFLRAFAASLVVLVPGILSAPNFTIATGLGIAAFVASLAAGLKAVQVFVPQLSFKSVLTGKYAAYYVYLDSFVRAFVAAFITAVLGLLTMPDLNLSRSLVVGVLVAAFAAGFRAVQGFLTPGDVPAPQKGFTPPVARTP